jgi:hypothetical protein
VPRRKETVLNDAETKHLVECYAEIEELRAQVRRLQAELAAVTTAKVLSPSPYMAHLMKDPK